jgi:hypothetical protein
MRLDGLRGAVWATTRPLQSELSSVDDVAAEGSAAVEIADVVEVLAAMEVPAAVQGLAIVVKA